jgi:hypothetical protein
MHEATSHAFLDELTKIGYAKEFAAGVDPFGIWSGRYGQEAQREGISEGKHKARQLVGTAGGVLGGGLLVPSAISGIMGAVGGAKGGLGGAARGFVKGFKKPVGSLVQAGRARGLLRRAAKSGSAVASKAEGKALRGLAEQVPVGDLAAAARGQGKGVAGLAAKAKETIPELLQAGQGGLRISAEHAAPVQAALKAPIRKAVTGVGLGGAVGGLGAYAQYGKGRQAEKEFQQRLKEKSSA